MNDTGARGSAELWLDAAYEALVEGGVDAVRILPLAQRLNLARTSFYWFFKDREELLAALADRWAAKNSAALIAATQAYAETESEAMLNVIAAVIDPAVFDSRFEFAVRSWALQSPAMMERLNAADRERLAALGAMMERWGHPLLESDVRAHAVYLTQIGYIALQVRETLAERMRRVPLYVNIFTGQPPEPRELARFHARFGYDPNDEEAA
ncbi:Transcriptional regulator, TetR family [Rubellimicrobium mesophilum DSM 19309]|uniref:Transcriptional regulator, TetR family n=1 Tax=Rubellimicrobium mesophilum DSM 19309 TaxID=442562 RepID=A0A017HN60_9RHOB|nr:TetR/AcrR family transcriptional regulator [Rubellimicrobium mesophilum]EYD75224.1 Transcriptional regulator, TetR family [Rubellimicrobium mesophilum DSM 19309]